MTRKDLTGMKLNKLTVISFNGVRGDKKKKGFWLCKCDCGKETVVESSNLLNGHTQSCGCFRRQQIFNSLYVHGGSHKMPEHSVWTNMIARCTNPKNKSYKDYGGRGIKVCERWAGSKKGEGFANFYEDMGQRPSNRHTLERIRVNDDYSPYNCIWILKSEQGYNTRRTVKVWYKGELLPLSLACRTSGVISKTLYSRKKSKNCTHQQAFDFYILPKSKLINHSFGYIN